MCFKSEKTFLSVSSKNQNQTALSRFITNEKKLRIITSRKLLRSIAEVKRYKLQFINLRFIDKYISVKKKIKIKLSNEKKINLILRRNKR